MPKKSQRRQRRHGDLPAGFTWRDGRPRWVPSPARRAQGWRGVDLKDQWGKFLARGAAIERATAIAEAAAAFAQGRTVPAAFAAFAPSGSTKPTEGAVPAKRFNPRSIGALLDQYQASNEWTLDLGEATRKDYRAKLNRFLDVLASPRDPKTGAIRIGDKPSEAKIAKVKALDIDVLLPPAFGAPGNFELKDVYQALRKGVGVSMAAGVHACVSAWLGWCVEDKRIWPTNPAKLVKRETPAGRIVTFEFEELIALVKEAEARELWSIADAIVLAVDLSWSQQDLLALSWEQVRTGNDGVSRVKHTRIKTGNAGNPPLLVWGAARIEAIRTRKVLGVGAAPILVAELDRRTRLSRTDGRWNASDFRHRFAEIRDTVAETMPAVADKQFRDLRDTAITYGYEAGLTIEEICSRSLHNPSHAQKVIEQHYGKISQFVADGAGRKLDEHFKRLGYSF